MTAWHMGTPIPNITTQRPSRLSTLLHHRTMDSLRIRRQTAGPSIGTTALNATIILSKPLDARNGSHLPNSTSSPPRPTSSHQKRYSCEQIRSNGSGEYNRQHLRPHSDVNASQPQLSRTGSPLPRAMSIPPGYSLDTKTGQLVSTMLPPSGHHSAPVKYW